MTKKIIYKAYKFCTQAARGIVWYASDFVRYRRLARKAARRVSLRFFPQLFDRSAAAHTFDKHYVYMDRWAFKNILKDAPGSHVDVGSSIRFLSMVSSVIPTIFVDIRPLSLDFDQFSCRAGSITALPFADSSLASLSCLHVAEHIGLGRYGDPLDPEGTQKACKELIRVLAPGGKLYFALPVGRTVTYFNAHRVHSPSLVIEYFSSLQLLSFAAVGDDGHFNAKATMADYEKAQYACGMFEFTKLA